MLLSDLRAGKELSLRQQILLVLLLSYPTVIAMLTTVVTEYIDAAMVGRIGAAKAASIGLISSSLWLVGGVVSAFATGFQVQVAHRIGANEEEKAKRIVRFGLLYSLLFSLILLCMGLLVYRRLPYWLGGDPSLCRDASRYAFVYVLMLPVMQLSRTAGGMVQSAGQMRVNAAINVLVCVLDAVFNYFLIFDTHRVRLFSLNLTIPGAGLDVVGASLGTMLAEAVGGTLMLLYLFTKAPGLKQKIVLPDFAGESEEALKILRRALMIGTPIAAETMITNSAQIVITKIVAPLGAVSIAANSFAITAEGFCYMPGYGVAIAATTLIGQCIGANRKKLAGRFGYLVTALGMALMAGTGVILWIFAPGIMAMISPDPAIQELGASVLRIEAFAEPFFAASMVVGGVFRGRGKTLMPSVIDLISMWLVRIPLAAFLSGRIGLRGVWIAMCVELTVRGLLFLGMLVNWERKLLKQ